VIRPAWSTASRLSGSIGCRFSIPKTATSTCRDTRRIADRFVTPDSVRLAAWHIVCAGGYFAAGFISTLGHRDVWNRIEPGTRHPLLIREAGAAAHLAALYEFVTAMTYRRMSRRKDFVEASCLYLGFSHETYIGYLPHGGGFPIKRESAGPPLTGRWFDRDEEQFNGASIARSAESGPSGTSRMLKESLRRPLPHGRGSAQ
jgi:hypothetical protein